MKSLIISIDSKYITFKLLDCQGMFVHEDKILSRLPVDNYVSDHEFSFMFKCFHEDDLKHDEIQVMIVNYKIILSG